MKRVSITLDDRVFAEIERVMSLVGEVNRSRFISSIIVEKLGEFVENPVAAVVVLVYDHSLGEVVKNITEIQHSFRDVIRANTHIHLDEDNCLEVIHAVGDSSRIRELVGRVSRAGKGVKFLRVVSIPANL